MIGFVQSIITIVLFLALLGILVVIHELGHFVTARLAKVRVHEFGIGFPPRARVLGEGRVPADDLVRYEAELEAAKARSAADPDAYEALLEQGPPRGTLYTLNWLPIGGFVKLEGEDGELPDDPRSFSAQGLPTKLIILVAGVAMNVVLAFVIFAGISWLASPLYGLRFFEVQPGSPAAEAGLVPGDAIVALDGQRFQFMAGPGPLDAVRSKAGETVVLTIDGTDGARRDVTVTLREPAEAATQGALGISQRERPWEGYFDGATTTNALPDAIAIGTDQTIRALGLIVGGLGLLVGSVAADPTAPPPVAGPVGIAIQIGDIFWNAGPLLTLYVAAILSANLAVVNILPFPPLDGGRMLIITLKRIFGTRISLRAEQLTYVVGFVFLFAFIIWVTGFDIVRSLGGGTPGAP